MRYPTKRFLLLVAAVTISSNAFAATVIEPSHTYTTTFTNLAVGTYVVECALENPNYQKEIVDVRATVEGYYPSVVSLNARFGTYKKDFIRTTPDNTKITLSLENLDTAYPAIVESCKVTHVYN